MGKERGHALCVGGAEVLSHLLGEHGQEMGLDLTVEMMERLDNCDLDFVYVFSLYMCFGTCMCFDVLCVNLYPLLGGCHEL